MNTRPDAIPESQHPNPKPKMYTDLGSVGECALVWIMCARVGLCVMSSDLQNAHELPGRSAVLWCRTPQPWTLTQKSHANP